MVRKQRNSAGKLLLLPTLKTMFLILLVTIKIVLQYMAAFLLMDLIIL